MQSQEKQQISISVLGMMSNGWLDEGEIRQSPQKYPIVLCWVEGYQSVRQRVKWKLNLDAPQSFTC